MTFGSHRLRSTQQPQGYICLYNDSGSAPSAEIFPVRGRKVSTAYNLDAVQGYTQTLKPSFSPNGQFLAHPDLANSLSDSLWIYIYAGSNTWSLLDTDLVADVDYQENPLVCSFNNAGTRLAIGGVYNGTGLQYGVSVITVPASIYTWQSPSTWDTFDNDRWGLINTWDGQDTWDTFENDQWVNDWALLNQYIQQVGDALTINYCQFNYDDSYLAAVGIDNDSSPTKVWIIKLSNGTEIKPATQPYSTARSCAWGSNYTYLAVAARYTSAANSDRVIIYKNTSTDTWTVLTSLLALTGIEARSVAFDPTSTYLAVGLDSAYSGSSLQIYKRSGDTFTLLTAPATVPTDRVDDIQWSENGSYLMVCQDGTNSYLYQRKGDTFILAYTFGDARGCAVYPRGINAR